MNTVNLIGRIARDVELKYTPAGKAVAHLTIAVDRGFGENKQTDWLPVTCWEQSAEFAANHLEKGRLVSVEGRLQSRQWEDNEGKKRTSYDVVARQINGLGPKPGGNSGAGPVAAPAAEPAAAPAYVDPFEDQ